MPQSKEFQKQMRNKIIEISQSGKGYKAVSRAQTPANPSESHYEEMAKTWNSGKPSHEWPADQNHPKSAATKDSRTTFKELQASLAPVKVTVHDSTIRKSKTGLHGRFLR